MSAAMPATFIDNVLTAQTANEPYLNPLVQPGHLTRHCYIPNCSSSSPYLAQDVAGP